MPEKVVITGADGYIGTMLSNELRKAGMEVIRLTRSGSQDKDHSHDGVYDLGMDCFPEIEGAGTIIHCAWAFGKKTGSLNIKACQVLLEYATRNESRVIFLGSFSASPHSRSAYGKAKHYCAKMLSDAGHLVIHPGLVIGDGGLYERLRQLVIKLPFIPVPGRGDQPLQLITGTDLAAAVAKGIEEGILGSYHLATRKPITFRNMIAEIIESHKLSGRILTLPVPVYRASLAIAAGLGLTSVSMENLEGLLGNSIQHTGDDLVTFGLEDCEPAAVLAAQRPQE